MEINAYEYTDTDTKDTCTYVYIGSVYLLSKMFVHIRYRSTQNNKRINEVY